MTNLFKFFSTLLNLIDLNKSLFFFCENNAQYKKVFEKKIEYHISNTDRKIFLIKYRSNFEVKNNSINLIRINNEFELRLLFSVIKNCLIITTTPTINKQLSKKNKFLLTQHSLGLLENRFIRENLRYFDFISVNNKYQNNHLNGWKFKKKQNYKILKEKYYDLDYIFEYKKFNKNFKVKTILIASSFYGNSIIKNISNINIHAFIKDHKIIFRPHPESLKNTTHIDNIKKIQKQIGDNHFEVSTHSNVKEDILRSDLLITDFSGIILSYFMIHKKKFICLLENKEDYKELIANIPQDILNFGFIEYGYNNYSIAKLVNSSIKQNQNPIAKALVDSIFADFKKNINYFNLI